MSRFHTVPVWLLTKDRTMPYYPDGPYKQNGWRSAYHLYRGSKVVFRGPNQPTIRVQLPRDFVEQLRLWGVLTGAIEGGRDE